MTAPLPTPAAVPPGWTVRVIIPHRTYTSPVMSPGEALLEKERLSKAVRDIGGAMGLVSFTTYDGREVEVRGRAITAVEAGPPAPLKDHQAGPVHVHLHVSDKDTDDVAALVRQTTGAVPTPAVLADRRRPR